MTLCRGKLLALLCSKGKSGNLKTISPQRNGSQAAYEAVSIREEGFEVVPCNFPRTRNPKREKQCSAGDDLEKTKKKKKNEKNQLPH